jgi:superkiller protein 3
LFVFLLLLIPVGIVTVRQIQESQKRANTEFAKELSRSIQSLFQAGKLPEARSAAKQWITLQPENAQAWREYGTMSAAVGDFAEARLALDKAIALKPLEGEAYLTLGGVLFAQKDYPTAEAACRKAVELMPNNAQAVLGLTRVLLIQKQKLPEAETLARKVAQLEAGVAINHFTLGQALLGQNKGKEARQAVLRGIALDPANPNGYDLLAQANQQIGDGAGAKKATAEAEAIRKFVPGSETIPLPVRVARGEALLDKESYSDALAEFIEVIRRDKTQAGALEGAGLALWQLNDRTTGSTYLTEAIRQDPGRVRSRIALAIAAYENGQYEGAARLLKPVTEQQPNNAMAWHLLGRARATQQMHDTEAETALRRAVGIEEQNLTYLMDFADTLKTNNKLAEAEAAFRKALALSPNEPEINGRFGAFLATLPEPEKQAEAQKLLESALKSTPGDPYCQFHLGKLFVQQEKYAEAVPLLEGASGKGQGRTKDVWSVLARAYQKTGQREKATAALAEADKIQKESDRYDKAIERLAANLNDPQARLEMARAAANRGEAARAIVEYTSYLRRMPSDKAVQQEQEQYIAALKKAGTYPDMNLYTRLNSAASSEKVQ